MESTFPAAPPTTSYGLIEWPIALVMAGLAYWFSLWYVDAYYLGDVVNYARFYDAIYQVDPALWPMLQRNLLGSAEPLYPWIISLGTNADMGRVPYLSLWNAVLIGALTYALAKRKASIIFAALLFTNYYLFVMLGPAERLKFAYICLAIMLCFDSLKARAAFGMASIFFHAQALIQLVAAAGYLTTKKLRDETVHPGRKMLFISALIVAVVPALYYFFGIVGVNLTQKAAFYSEQSAGVAEAFQWVLLFIAGMWVFENRVAFAMAMLPLGAFTALYGDRINIATLALFIALAVEQRKTSNPVILLVMAYMSFKSIQFLQDVAQYGTGYPGA